MSREKKNPSSVMSVGLYSYIQQVMKSSSLGWFIDWQELESKVTAGLAISCCGSVFVGSNFQHEGKRKACVKQAAPWLRSWAGKGSSTPTLLRKEKDCSLKKHRWEGQHPKSFLPQCRELPCPSSCNSSISHPAFPCLSFPTGRAAGRAEECECDCKGPASAAPALFPFPFPSCASRRSAAPSLDEKRPSRRAVRAKRGLRRGAGGDLRDSPSSALLSASPTMAPPLLPLLGHSRPRKGLCGAEGGEDGLAGGTGNARAPAGRNQDSLVPLSAEQLAEGAGASS